MGELFKLKTGVRATLVPYPSPQQRMVDLLAGTIHFDFLSVAMAAELVSSGKLRALAVMAPTRLPVLREVSTVVEQAFPDLIVEDWVGFTVKSGTPDEKVARLNESVNTTLAKPKDALANLGAEPAGGTSAEFGIFIKSQVAHWGKVVATMLHGMITADTQMRLIMCHLSHRISRCTIGQIKPLASHTTLINPARAQSTKTAAITRCLMPGCGHRSLM